LSEALSNSGCLWAQVMPAIFGALWHEPDHLACQGLFKPRNTPQTCQ
jgi:hypothetical protein